YLRLGQAQLRQQLWSEAFKSLQTASELDPSLLEAQVQIGRLNLAARQYKEANDAASALIAKNPNYAPAYQVQAAALVGLGKSDEALTAFTKALELKPHDAESYDNLALVEITLKQYPQAEQHLLKAIDVNPKFEQGYVNLANFYRLQQQLPKAEQSLRQ